MPQYQHDTTWEVRTVDGKEIVVELDVRVYYNFTKTYGDRDDLINVLEVKALFRKHGKWIELDIPEDLRVLAMKHFDISFDFAEEVYTTHDEIARDEAADAEADHIRERKESNND